MALVVETGAGLANADAFVSVADFKAYCDRYGYTYTTDTLIGQAVVRATAFISDSFAWQGWRVKGRSHVDGAQALSWPRYDVTDDDGHTVLSTTIPPEIVKATIEVARRELASPGSMTPDYVPADRVKSTSVKAGPVSTSTEFDNSRTDAASVRPIILAVLDMIGPFLANGGGSTISGASTRV